MKTTNTLGFEINVNDARANCEISIRLHDDCNNGHEDFSVTATFWTVGKKRCDRTFESGGCCHEQILELKPELKLFVDLHLSDSLGAPMHAVANGLYHIQQGNHGAAKRHLRVSDDEYEKLRVAESKEHLSIILEDMGIVYRWSQEAIQAIEILEKKTRKTFASKATRSQYTPLTKEQRQQEQERIDSGYYDDPERIEQRAKDAKRLAKHQLLLKIDAKRDKALAKARTEHQIETAIVEHFGKNVNVIWYSHTNELCFNWASHQDLVEDDEIELFESSNPNLPTGIKTTNKGKGRFKCRT